MILCSGNNYPPVCNEILWPGMATGLIRICYNPRNYKQAHKTPVLISALPVFENNKDTAGAA